MPENKAQIFDTGTFDSLESDGSDDILGNEDNPEGNPPSLSKITLSGAPLSAPEPNKDDSLGKYKKKKEKKVKTPKISGGLTVDAITGTNVDFRAKKAKKAEKAKLDKIHLDPDGIYKENKYYTGVARKYKFLKILCMLLAAIFVGSMFFFCGSALTLDSFKYLVKDLDFSSLNTGDFSSMVYNGGSRARFGVYRGELIVVSQGLTSLFKPSGAPSFTIENDYYSPALRVADKYFLVYDVGNTSYGYSVYNSFSSIISVHLDYPITDGAICDTGEYCIVSRDDNYKSIIYVYNSDLEQILEIRKEKYTVSVDLSPDGNTLLIACLYDKDGEYVTEISVVDVESGVETQNITIPSYVPLQIKYLKNGNIAVMYTNCISIYDPSGFGITQISPSLSAVVTGYLCSDLICMTNNRNVIGNEKDVRIYDCDGKEIFGCEHTGELVKITDYNGCIFMLFQDHVLKIDPVSGAEFIAKTEANAIDIVFTSEGKPYVCFSGSALELDFEEQ